MSLTRRQRSIVDVILQETLREATQARRDGEKLLDRSLLNEEYELDEAGPDADRIDTSIIKDQLTNVAQDLGKELADALVFRFRQKICTHIANVMNQHAMGGDIRINPRTLADELEDFDTDSVMGASLECAGDITDALEKYAKDLGDLAVHMAGGDTGNWQ